MERYGNEMHISGIIKFIDGIPYIVNEKEQLELREDDTILYDNEAFRLRYGKNGWMVSIHTLRENDEMILAIAIEEYHIRKAKTH